MRHLRLASLSALVFFAVACTETPVSIEPEADAHSHSEEALFTNSGFESGNLNGWTTSNWLVATSPGVTAYPVTQESQLGLRTGGVAKTSAVNAPSGPYTLVPPGMTATETARYPRFGNWAAVVNDQGSSYNANKITQNSVVTTADIDPADGLVHVRFVVLPVLQNPGHTVREQPYYYVAINNLTKGTQLTSRFNFSNEAGVPWQSNANGSIVYTDWLLFDLPLSRNAVSIGDTLQAVIVAGGCAQGGHWGEAIIDSFGSFIPGLVAYGSGPDSVEAGSDFQYTYRVLNGSTVTSTGTELTAYLPAGTTFRSVDTAGISCTTPTVGTRGTVSCNLGAIGAGASTTVKITVRADSTATGEIRHGWYFSKSNQEKPLTGPLVTTKVTTGGTTQYVDLVTTVDDATTSLTWGQQNTWAITVLNRGPTTATNARLVTNTPANLNTLTWTCTAQSGASCGSASGTGAIDALATIPAGKSVTWSLKANVNAGLGTGMVSVTANATAPSGTVEQYALDNGSGDDDTLSILVLPVTVNRQGVGEGELIATPAGLSCGAGCSTVSGNFASGTQVTVNAVPAAGSMFTGWSGGTCTGTAACTFTTTLSHTVTGTFAKIPTLITSPATANAAVGKPFSYTVTANGTAPITLSATNLPAWASFNASTGVISGTPTATGSATINLSATDVNGTATQTLTLTIGTAPTITSALTFTVASSGNAWTNVVVTATGSATIQYNASNLPGTVYFNSTTGAFNGSSAANGVFNIPVVATNAFGSDYKTIAVSVGSAPVITSSLTSAATVGTAWTYTLTATPSGVTLSTNNLPAWATFNASTGVISGTPTTAGTVSIGVAASNSIGTSSQTLVLTVDGPAVITSALTANGTAGQAFAYTLNAEGTTPITRQVTGLQAWMNFDASTGLLSGTPPAPGTFTVNLSATNAIGSDAKTLTITIAAPPPTPTPPSINSSLTTSGAVGTAFTYTITASGAVPMTYAATGLPAWASFDAATGTITGTPSEAGTHNIAIKATNSLGEDNKTLVITIVSPPVITSSLTAGAVVGDSFSYTTTASGSGPITFTATGLPAWASYVGGVLSGTPTAEGDVTVALRAQNSGGADTKNLVISVRTRPAITSSLNAEGTVGTAFSYTVTASGTAPRTLTTGTLPSWATFNASTGVISGTPTAEGNLTINLGVSNAAGTDSKTLNLVIRKRAEVTSPSTADAVVGQAFSYTMTATGTAPLTFSATGLPAWLSFNASTGVLSGTPSASGSVQVSLTADNAAGSDTRTLTITIRTKPSITSALTAEAIVGQAFNYAATATGSATITWSASGLPAWASLNASTGAITGTPTSDVDASIVITATNSAGSDSKTLNITVRAKPAITSALNVDAVVGQAFSYAASATGTSPLNWTATGLPAWASLNASTGAITGTPTADTNATISLTVTNAAGSDTKTLNITVRAKPAITSALTADAVVGQAFSYTLTATGTAPRTLSVSGLPAWASFNASSGIISGTPTADVDATIALSVSNAAGSDTRNLVITVRAKPAITSALTATAIVGESFSYTMTASGTEPRTLSVSGLPTWASFNNGVITGTPDADVNATIALTVTNAAGSDTKNLVITVRAKPSITSALTAIATVGESFSYTVTASGTAPRTLSVSGLPAWASFNASSGIISGTPTADVDATIALTVTNAAGSDTKNLVITVRAKPAITSALTATAIVGEAFSYTLTASGTEPRTLSVSGLPAWATFSNGIITGTPDADVNATIALTVTNAAGTDTKNLVITVRAKPAITSALTAIATVGESFTYTLTASGTEPRTLSVSGLPAWASFNNGVISGTPTADVDATIALTVTNAAGSDTKNLVITVRAKPSITSALTAVAVVGESFSYTLTATGTEPRTLSVSGLPAWATFSNGIITGTPDSDVDATIALTVTNAAGSDTKNLVITVRAKPSITSALTAIATVGESFSYTVTANGTEPRTLSVSGLPAWASFNASTGLITGTPTADVDATIALTVTNAAGSDTKNLVITVRAKPSITSALTATANVGDAFTYTLTANGTEPRTLSVSGLPTWAQFDASTGIISGTPDADVDASIVLTVTNAAGSDSKTLQLTVRAKPSITSALTAVAIVDESFSYTLTASGTEPRTLSVGNLPSWLHFNASMGQLFGTPTADVDADIELTVTNAAGTDTKTLHITVRAKPAITSAMNAEAVVGQAFNFTVTATGTAPRTLSVAGLPSWLSFDASTGELSGTPSSDVDATLVITVTNAAGSASKNLHITVRAKPVVTSVLAVDGIVGLPFSYTLTANGTAPMTLATGMLPSWLSFDAATGVLSGVPTADGQSSVLISVTNAAGSDTKTLVITVRTLPVITSASSIVGVEGSPLSMAITTTGTSPIVISATGLPAGLSLVNGVITGTPSAPGHSEVVVTATNGAGTVTQTIVIDVRSPLSVPVIDAPAANAVLNTNTVVISGTLPAGEAGGQVKVSDGNTLVCTAQVQADGSWSCTATLTEGAHHLTAKLVDVSNFEGPSSVNRDFVVDLTAPVGPTVTSPGSVINTDKPTFSGTGEVGASVTVERNGYTVCVAIVGADGKWSCTPSMPLPEGASAFAIVQRDAAGNTSATTTVTTTIDVTAPSMPTMTSPVAGSVMGNTMVNFTGTAEAGTTVKVFVDGEERCTAVADANGHFSCSAMLGDGGHQITVTSTDAAGNSTTTAAMNMQVDTTAPAAPMLTNPIGGTSTGTPTYSGTGEPGATVRVVIDGQQACMTTVAANGTWSCTVTSPLSEGTHTVSITITDGAGHTSQSVDGTIDVRGSTGTVTPVTGSVGSNDNGHIEGTATPGATVNVYVDGQLVGTVTADENGHWSFDLPLLGAGEHTVSVGVVGKDGRETPAGETVLTVNQSSFDIGGGGFGCSTSSGSPTWVVALLVLGALWRRGSKKAATVAKSVAAVAVATVATTASAQSVEVSGFDLEQLQLNPGARSALVVGGGDVLQPMDFRVAASLGYQHAPLVYFQDGERRAALVENRLTTTLSGAFGVLPWLEVGASVPLVVFQNGQAVTSSRGDMIAGAVPQQVSFGTPWLQARLAPFQERNGAPVDFGVTLAVGIPLGTTGSLTSEPYVTGQVIAGAARTVGPVRIALDLGAHLRADRTIAVNDVIGSRLLGGLGVSTINGPLRGEVSLRGFIPLSGEPVSAELLGGARYSFGDFEVFGLAGPGIGNSPGTPAFRALVGVSFGGVKSGRCTLQSADPSSCPGLDYDGDGIKNGEDACPMQAGSCAPVVEVVKPSEVVEAAPAVVEAAPAAPIAEPAAEAVPQVELKQDRIEIHGEVHFESGRAVIGSDSFMLLNEVASLLNAHPEVKSVRVEGHTDDRGGAAANMKLSKDRAAAVRTYLVKQGVADARLTSEGYGQTKPVMSNETAAGREKNRRVMFTIAQ